MTQEMRKVSDLSPHPLNDFAPELSEEFIESIRQYGVRFAIRITHDNLIVSGKRRWLGAKQVGIAFVPVDVVNYPDQDEIKADATIGNFTRNQTNEFKAQMLKKTAELLRPASIDRRKAGTAPPNGDEAGGRTMAIAAKEVGWSEMTGRKAVQVLDAILDAKGKKDWEKAEELRTQLNDVSVESAFRAAAGTTKKPRPPKKPKGDKSPASLKGHLLLCRQAMSKLTQAVQLAEQAGGGPNVHSERIRKATNAVGQALEEWRNET